MLSKNRDQEAAEKFLEKAIGCSGLPDKVTIDKNGANKAGLEAIKYKNINKYKNVYTFAQDDKKVYDFL